MGHRAVVTGSSGGIGEAIARKLAAEGADVIVHGRHTQAVNAVARAISADGGQAEGLTADLADTGDCASLISRALAGGGIDILVNNAGLFANRGWDEAAPEDWLALYATNVAAAVRCIQGFLPAMRASGWGRIVQIGTGEAVNPFPTMPDYAASKAALLNLTASLAKHLDRTGITVNTISPGIVVTPGVRDFYRIEARRRGWGEDWPARPPGRSGQPRCLRRQSASRLHQRRQPAYRRREHRCGVTGVAPTTQRGEQHVMRYTLLGNSGLRVSEVALGTMTFGTDWGWGASAGESARQFELFASAGGTLIDTANKYTNGSAESILGDLLAADRDHFVVGTKYSLNVRDGDLNAGGNHRKSLVQALEASLRRLRTDHVDILWLHAWDYLTPPEEVMRALDDQVRLGKVLYLGVSDTPAWRVAQMQTLAAARGWSAFAGLQIEYSLVQREVERELIPMARGLGLGVLAWGPLGAGVLSGKYANPDSGDAERRLAEVDPGRLAIAQVVGDVAGELGLSSSVVALAWLRAQGGVIPILGARTAQQLADNLTCLDVELPADSLGRLDQAGPVALGFPHDFLASADFIFGGMSGQLDAPPGSHGGR